MRVGAYQLIKAANPAAVVLLGGLAANGDDKPIWITEIGFSAARRDTSAWCSTTARPSRAITTTRR